MTRLQHLLNLEAFERPARAKLPRCIFEFIQRGSEDETSARENRAAFERVPFIPLVLVDTSGRTASAPLLGQTWAAPFGIAPMGAMSLAARDADRAMARAARKANIPFVLSGAALTSLEAVIREYDQAWFQAYLTAEPDRDGKLLARVEAAGYRTLVVTADVPVTSNREADIRNGYTSPLRPSVRLGMDGLRHPRWLFGTLLRTLLDAGMPHFENFGTDRVPMLARRGRRIHRRDRLGWEALAEVRRRWPHRLILKGVLAAQDVARAKAIGVDAVVVSNHGGRQLDGAIAPIRALAALQGRAGGMPLLMDSGIRRGTDVIKALALGASHVLVGRPFLYAAVVGGEAGVAHAISLLKAEIERNMALLGCRTLADVSARMVQAGGVAAIGVEEIRTGMNIARQAG
ncbi:alpha-hydroxy acid oxidase [Pigmentiphaga soli]|uniref:Alpha-hydroxy acid oxidase n=1 Tax=Pigmentiphaga soli TaxID=1007095 RepID=A0ABP8GFT2_9BURK